MRFVHVADVHLDTSFAGRSAAVRLRLREASRDALRRATDLAIREDVHALLIAGDLSAGDRLSFQTERFLLAQLGRLAEHDITVIYATGNHDPGSSLAGPRQLDWPSNVHVAGDATPKRVLVTDRDGAAVGYVTAVGHATDNESRDLSRLLPRPEGKLPEVALLHTQVHSSLGAAAHHPYAPSDLTYLTRSGYDYWALGHVHIRQELTVDPPVAYSGSLVGRTHTDTGARGALLVDLSDRDAPAISFRPVAPVRWETLTVDHLESADSLDRLERQIQVAWSAFLDADGGAGEVEWMVRVHLQGPCALWKDLQTDENRTLLGEELTELLGALDVVVTAERVHPIVRVQEHRIRTDVLGESLRLLEALRLGNATLSSLEAGDLAGLVSDDRSTLVTYVNDLLQDVDGELAARLLASDGDTL
jgi:exonuclease SbcD